MLGVCVLIRSALSVPIEGIGAGLALHYSSRMPELATEYALCILPGDGRVGLFAICVPWQPTPWHRERVRRRSVNATCCIALRLAHFITLVVVRS